MNIGNDWLEYHTEDGKKYYYNTKLNTTQWERPLDEQLNSKHQSTTAAVETNSISSANTTDNTNSGNNTAEATIDDDPWIEYFDKSSNRPYYYNKVTNQTTWTKPPKVSEVDSVSENSTINRNDSGSIANDDDDDRSSRMMDDEVDQRIDSSFYGNDRRSRSQSIETRGDKSFDSSKYTSKENAIKSFKNLLRENKIGTNFDWQMTLKKIAGDVRYKAIRSMTEKKKLFYEYTEEKRKEDKEKERQKRRKTKDDFTQLLRETKELTIDSRYRDIYSLIENDARYLAIESEEERFRLFDDHIHDLRREKQKEDKAKRRKEMEDFHNLLKQNLDQGLITYKTLWRRLEPRLKESKPYQTLDKRDRLEVWDNFIANVQRLQKDKIKRDRERKRKKEIKNRVRLWKLFESKYREGLVNFLSRWKQVEPLVTDEEEHILVYNQDGPSPKDLFEVFLDHLELIYKEDRRRMKATLKENSFNFEDSNIKYSQFCEILKKSDEYERFPSNNIKIFYEEVIDKAKEGNLKKRKREIEESKEQTQTAELLPNQPNEQIQKQSDIHADDQNKLQNESNPEDSNNEKNLQQPDTSIKQETTQDETQKEEQSLEPPQKKIKLDA